VDQGDRIAFSFFGFGVASLIIGIVVWYDRQLRSSAAPPKKQSTRDFDSFLDEYESSNDYHGDSEGENLSLSRSFGDFDEVRDSDDEGSDEVDCYESESASPLYSDPDKSERHLEVL
jgi:hypothetical protein